jgi:putative hemolysin
MPLDSGSIIDLALVPLCLVALALNVAAETALSNISRLRLRQLLDRGIPRAQLLSQILDRPRLNTILRSADLLVIVALSGLVLDGAGSLTRRDLVVDVGALALTALVALICCVLAPQAIAVRNPERAALLLLPYVSALQAIIGPPLTVLYWVARPLARVLDGGHEAGHYITEEEMRQLVNPDDEDNVIPAEEEDMIQQIFEFSDTVAREVMVPRTDIIAAADTESLPVVVDRILDCGHTRLPVYHESMDNIVGIVNAKDLLSALRHGQTDHPLIEFARPAHFIPETKKVDDLLRDLQRHRLPMAIVVDEYGGTAGLLTVEDLVEEIVGEIQDEYDKEPTLLEAVGPNEWKCDARLPLDDLNDLLGTTLQGVDVETVGGLVQERLGRIPNVGDYIVEQDLLITVLATEGLRVKVVGVRRGPPEESADPAGGANDAPIIEPSPADPVSVPAPPPR